MDTASPPALPSFPSPVPAETNGGKGRKPSPRSAPPSRGRADLGEKRAKPGIKKTAAEAKNVSILAIPSPSPQRDGPSGHKTTQEDPRLSQAAPGLPPAPSLRHSKAPASPHTLPVSPPSPVTRSPALSLVHPQYRISAQLRLDQCPAPAAPPFYTHPEPSRRPRLPCTALTNRRAAPAHPPCSDWPAPCVTRAGRGRCAPAGPAFSNLHALSPRPPEPRGGRGFPRVLANQRPHLR